MIALTHGTVGFHSPRKSEPDTEGEDSEPSTHTPTPPRSTRAS